jgi:CelD/BcsL family acetyltransferase involved in cellulose biosynthesis
LDELVLQGRRIGVNVALGRGAVHWNYNFGVAPDALTLGPGIALQQLSIRNAIERGRRTFDMGPGVFDYKFRAGGAIDDRVNVRAASPSSRGRAVAALETGAGRTRTALRQVRDRRAS